MTKEKIITRKEILELPHEKMTEPLRKAYKKLTDIKKECRKILEENKSELNQEIVDKFYKRFHYYIRAKNKYDEVDRQKALFKNRYFQEEVEKEFKEFEKIYNINWSTMKGWYHALQKKYADEIRFVEGWNWYCMVCKEKIDLDPTGGDGARKFKKEFSGKSTFDGNQVKMEFVKWQCCGHGNCQEIGHIVANRDVKFDKKEK